jgi:hypothetical protein
LAEIEIRYPIGYRIDPHAWKGTWRRDLTPQEEIPSIQDNEAKGEADHKDQTAPRNCVEALERAELRIGLRLFKQKNIFARCGLSGNSFFGMS